MTRPIHEIAREINRNWRLVSPYAQPYLRAMMQLNDVTEYYYNDSAKSIILYFLSNASGWRGETARTIKAELNRMVK